MCHALLAHAGPGRSILSFNKHFALFTGFFGEPGILHAKNQESGGWKPLQDRNEEQFLDNTEQETKSHSQKLRKIRIIAAISAAVLAMSCILLSVSLKKSSNQEEEKETASVEVVEEDASFEELVKDDIPKAGLHTYDLGDGNKLVLLSFGEVIGLGMSATPNIDGPSVYFSVSAVDIAVGSGPRYVYRLYKTDAKGISADMDVLLNPGYGVGSEGVNVGWVEPEDDGEFFVTPLFDDAPITRVFRTDAGVELGTGLYNYEFEVRTNGAYITYCEPIETYTRRFKVASVSPENGAAEFLTVERGVRIKAVFSDLSDEELSELKVCEGQDFTTEVTFNVVDGKLSILRVTVPWPSE